MALKWMGSPTEMAVRFHRLLDGIVPDLISDLAKIVMDYYQPLIHYQILHWDDAETLNTLESLTTLNIREGRALLCFWAEGFWAEGSVPFTLSLKINGALNTAQMGWNYRVALPHLHPIREFSVTFTALNKPLTKAIYATFHRDLVYDTNKDDSVVCLWLDISQPTSVIIQPSFVLPSE
jgi:hypothetical protein